jgi:hypothetical protein
MEVREGRVCKATLNYAASLNEFPPKGDNQNPTDLLANMWGLLGYGVPYSGQNGTVPKGARKN